MCGRETGNDSSFLFSICEYISFLLFKLCLFAIEMVRFWSFDLFGSEFGTTFSRVIQQICNDFKRFPLYPQLLPKGKACLPTTTFQG